jgi:fermentation-respiration switch protein FrsA (DUF1100 family)
MVTLVCAGVLVLAMAFEDQFIYFPSRYPEGFWAIGNLPARDGEIVPQIEDCYLTTADGIKLHGWLCLPSRKIGGVTAPVSTQMTLLWFHGNAGNISHRYDMIRMLIRIPINIFIVDYRGYGKSEGAPSEQGLYLDARTAWGYLTDNRGIPSEQIIIFGKSLGGAVAINLATSVQPAGLIVQSSFTSAADMAGVLVPFFPRLLLRTRMDSMAKILDVSCPKLFIHSQADEVVPYRLGRRLFEAATEPKRFYEVGGATHNETYLIGGEPYLGELRSFVAACKPAGRD